MLTCPNCGKPLQEEEKRALCENGHSFDRSREGYFNLLLNQGEGGHGDDKKMLLDRRAFLEKGYYDALLSALQEEVTELFLTNGVLVDAGCGEGYYTQGVDLALRSEGKNLSLFAFDISRDAVKMTARRLRARGCFFVASGYRIPMADASADGILSLFAPYAQEEFLRILKPGGFLIRVVPLEDHLYELKCAVYENPIKNKKEARIGEDFRLLKARNVQKMICLRGNEDIQALFGMTPYAHKTSPQDRKKLENLDVLETKMDVGIQIFQKFSEKTS